MENRGAQKIFKEDCSQVEGAKEANSVMNTPRGVAELMRYIGRTERFKDVFGELS